MFLLIEVKDQKDVGNEELRRILVDDSIEISHHTLSVVGIYATGKIVHPARPATDT